MTSWGERAAEQYEKDQPSTYPLPPPVPTDRERAIELLARQWRDNRRSKSTLATPRSERQFVEDSYRFARDALDQLDTAGIEIVLTEEGKAATDCGCPYTTAQGHRNECPVYGESWRRVRGLEP